MNNNTDKTIIDISNESLQDAYKRLRDENTTSIIHYFLFKAAANWQKEKDKAIQDKLLDALKMVYCDVINHQHKSNNKQFPKRKEAIENMEQLLNQLKETE